MKVRKFPKPPQRIQGTQYTDLVSCDFIAAGQLLAGYSVDEDGTILVTHLEANGLDIFQLAMEVPAAMKQIEQRLDADFWAHRIAESAEQRAEAFHEARRA